MCLLVLSRDQTLSLCLARNARHETRRWKQGLPAVSLALRGGMHTSGKSQQQQQKKQVENELDQKLRQENDKFRSILGYMVNSRSAGATY